MSFEMGMHVCPGCGAENEAAAFAAQVTCQYCSSVYLIDADGLKLTGQKSRLTPSIAGLAVGVQGVFKTRPFKVIGRVQYRWSRGEDTGLWDEWYMLSQDGEPFWVSEDMGKLRLEEEPRLDDETSELNAQNVSVGQSVAIANYNFTIMEESEAVCEGSEGQLPFKAKIGARYSFADGATQDGSKVLTLEFNKEKGPSVFIGTPMESADITYEKAKSSKKAQRGSSIKCPSCGSSIRPKGDPNQIASVVCQYCNTLSKLDKGTAIALDVCKPQYAKDFVFRVGAKGQLEGVRWTIVGRMRYDWNFTDYEDNENYTGTDLEYLIYNPDQGYKWLFYTDNEFLLGEPVLKHPSFSLLKTSSSNAPPFEIDGSTYFIEGRGTAKLVYVDGYLPWQAQIGEEVRYVDAWEESETLLFNEEETGSGENREIEYFLKRPVDESDVIQAFVTPEQLEKIKQSDKVQMKRPFWMRAAFYLAALGIVGAISYFNEDYIKKHAVPEETLFKTTYDLSALYGHEVKTRYFHVDKDEKINVQTKIINMDSSEVVPADIGLGVVHSNVLLTQEILRQGGKWNGRVETAGEYAFMVTVFQESIDASVVNANKGRQFVEVAVSKGDLPPDDPSTDLPALIIAAVFIGILVYFPLIGILSVARNVKKLLLDNPGLMKALMDSDD